MDDRRYPNPMSYGVHTATCDVNGVPWTQPQ
jgi:hypothetical protein